MLVKILFNGKAGREVVFKPTVGDETSHATSNINLIRRGLLVIKAGRLKWAEHVAHMEQVRTTYQIGKPDGNDGPQTNRV
jgi:hypothetical protein